MCIRSIFLLLFVAAGCAGQNRLSRGLDLKLNQLYVDNPALAEVVLPFGFVGMNLAMVADACFLNPWRFWHDAPAGSGSAYYYKDPITPANQLPVPSTAGASTKPEGKGDPKVPAPPPATRPSRDTGYITHHVQPGDTFSSLAQRYYNDKKRWKDIYRANQNVVPSENRIYPGRMLLIPTD